jgi:hypothetical protein
MRYLLCIALITSVLILGCGEDNELQETDEAELSVVSVAPAGGDIAANAVIALTFSKKVSSATIMINGAPVPAQTTDGKVYTFTPRGPGSFTLTVEAEDEAGQQLTGFSPLEFMASSG